MVSEYLEHKLALLPDRPGCYLMKDKNGKIIYIGKAKNLKNRVRSYFKSKHYNKTARLVENIADFETIITSTNKESLLLEITLIKKHRPYFNIKLKQSNSGYPYIKITNERNPRMLIVNNVYHDGAYYFGPYPNVFAASATLNFLLKVYPLRRCKGYQKRACLYYHMGQCLGSCFKEVRVETYQKQIKRIKSFLNGNTKLATRLLKKRMKIAAENQEYERAAEIRDQLNYVKATVEKQKIISNDPNSADIFNFYVDKGWVSVQVFFIRQARLIKREKHMFSIVNAEDDFLTNFIAQFYQQQDRILPNEIVVPKGVNKEVLEKALGPKNLQQHNTRIFTPQRGRKRGLLELLGDNAKLVLDEKFRMIELDNKKTTGALAKLSKKMHLSQLQNIEAFDHSHISGSDTVSALVVYTNGKPNKKMYRKYKLKTVVKADEAASTREVIRRRYTRLLKEHAKLPDLILMDGGEVQMNAAKDVLHNELSLDIPLAGMVKDDKHKTADLLYGNYDQPLHLDPHSSEFYLIQRIQDEVHRFAINYHHQLHNKNSFTSRLDQIKGIGPKTRNKLMTKFGSLKKIANASLPDLQNEGISRTVAQTIKLSFKNLA